VYKNVFHAHHTYRFSNFRGGTVFVYENALIYNTGSYPVAFDLTDEESWQTLLFTPLRTNWPALDQIQNSFFWANTLNGSPITQISLGNPNDATFIKENRDYWMHEPTVTNVYYGYRPLIYPHPRVTADDGGQIVAPPGAPRNLRVQQTQL
jgi:hypothetical protein